MTRRRFLTGSAIGPAGVLGFPSISRSARIQTEVRVATIGVGGFGHRTISEVASHPKVAVTAICDVDPVAIARARQLFPKAREFTDWRAMLADAGGDFDALVVCVPDHMHAPIGVTAMRAGKHVYVQKPLAATLHECRTMLEEARKNQVVTQLGNQRRSSIEDRTTVELLRQGAIGKVKEVILWENKPLSWWPRNTTLRPVADPLPEGFAWDLWLGVREPRPFLEGTYHPMSWRAWTDFGVGELGDMGCHHFDVVLDGLALSAPLRVRQTTESRSAVLWGERREVEFVFEGTEYTSGETLPLTWYDGDLRPDASTIQLPEGVEALPESGAFWVGERGGLFKSFRGGKPVVLDGSTHAPEDNPFRLEPRSHYHDWVDAILGGGKAVSDFGHGARLTETVLVGALADRFPQRWLEWDAAAMVFTGLKEADPWIRRTYRDGWQIPGLG